MDFLLQKIEQILRHQKRWKKWQKVVASLACIVVFFTTYALILPAITMDRDEAKSQGGIFWEESRKAEETIASADEQGTAQDGILSAEDASLAEEPSEDGNGDFAAEGTEELVGAGIASEENTEATSERPAAIFDEVAGDVTVHVEAPEGAFPAGTTMRVEPVAEEQVIAAVQEAVEESVTKVSAVDIIFLDALGNEIEPEAEIRVSMSSSVMENVEQPVIVHVDEEGVAETVESEQVDGSVVFESDRFSVYVLVETELQTEVILPGNNDTYVVTVTAPAEAKIPKDASLRVVSFEEGSEEFELARNSVLTDKLEKEEYVDINSFNIVALDISIIGPDGIEIEPAVSVKVDIKIKELPGVDDLSAIKDTLEIQHHIEVKEGIVIEKVFDGSLEGTYEMNTDEEIAATGIAFNPESVNATDFEKIIENQNGAEVNFNVDKFSTFTITWRNDYRKTNVHYGYLDSNNVFVPFDEQPTPGLDAATYYHLTYDFDGYSYYGVYRNPSNTNNPTTGTKISPLLQKDGSGIYQNLRYKKLASNGNVGEWENLANNDQIYVVYKEKVETTGGTPRPSSTETWPEGNDTPQFSKSSTNNGNGTNTISLSIKAAEKAIEQETKANIVVVLDVSGSMRENMAGTYEYQANAASKMDHGSRMWIAADAVNDLAYSMMTGKKAGLVKMALISFSDVATLQQNYTTNYNTFSGKVNALRPSGGTNWEGALNLANSLPVDQDAATFVIFVSDGDPTERESRGNITDRQLNSSSNQGVGYDVDDSNAYYVSYGIYGTGYANQDRYGYNFSCAVDSVAAIKEKNKNFYAIGVSSDVEKMEDLASQAGVSTDNVFLSTEAEDIQEAFEKIAQSISASLGFGDIEITDGITNLTNSSMKVLQSVDENSFKYYRYGGKGNKYGADFDHKQEWTTRESDGCDPASYNTVTGAVEWNMGEDFQLEDGVTYVVTFRVWPSQSAYDLIADLDNKVREVDILSVDEKSQIVVKNGNSTYYHGDNGWTADGGNTFINDDDLKELIDDDTIYLLKTNTDEVEATYKKTTKSGDVVSISDMHPINAEYTEGTIQDMKLTAQLLKIKKIFDQSLDPRTVDSVTLRLKRKINDNAQEFVEYNVPGTNSPNIVLSEDNNWECSFYVAPGFIADGELLEKGYQFTVTEPDLGENTVRYDLIPEIVNPMVVDGTLQLIGDSDGNQVLTAINRTRSAVEIHKTLYDVDGRTLIYPDTEFTITGKLLGPNGESFTSQETSAPVAYYLYDKDGNTTTGREHFADSNNISFKLKAGEFIRFVNVPEGCTFEFKEDSMPENYEFKSLAAVGRKRADNDPEYTYSIELTDEVAHLNEGSSIISTSTQGIIGNTNYKLDFYNKRIIPLPEIELIKVDQDDNAKKLNDAEFVLHKDSATGTLVSVDGNGNPISIKTGNKIGSTGPDGWCHIGKLPVGTYYLMETTPPANYKINEAPVIITVSGTNSYTVTATQNGVSVLSGSSPYTITVKDKLNTKWIRFMKTDADGSHPLGKAEFDFFNGTETVRLTSYDTGTIIDNNDVSGLMKNASGIYTFELPLSDTEYTLTEKKAPAGYNILADVVNVYVNSKGVRATLGETTSQYIITGAGTIEDPYLVKIWNSTGTELPHTGGTGTLPYTLGGIALIMASALMYGFRMRRGERRFN